MSAYASLFFRGWLMVTLVSLNTGQIAGQHWMGAGLVGYSISWIWWRNAHSAGHTDLPYAGELYAFGASLGTMTGMFITHWLY